MSRDYYPLDERLMSTLSVGTTHCTTPFESAAMRQNFSAALESSAFSSGSSVLSAFEPPTDTEFLEKTPFAHLLHESKAYTGSLEDLRAVIEKLQAIYFYRQGLQALANERGCHQSSVSGGSVGECHPFGRPSSVMVGTTAPTSIPRVTDTIWSMDDHQLAMAARAVEAAAVEKSMTPECLPQTPCRPETFLGSVSGPTPQTTDSVRGSYRRKSRRQRSCPVALCAPQWADASWDPKTSVKPHHPSSSHGTGVFIPPHLAQSPTTIEGSGNERDLGKHHLSDQNPF